MVSLILFPLAYSQNCEMAQTSFFAHLKIRRNENFTPLLNKAKSIIAQILWALSGETNGIFNKNAKANGQNWGNSRSNGKNMVIPERNSTRVD